MDAVKSFNAELSSLYEVKPPISKAKMTAITRGAIKAIKFYKHVVQSVEKFILKCKPEYKVPGLYVIDSIVRQSRHQFGADKDVFAPRFAKNMQQTFINLFKCQVEDKSKIIRVLNLWQKNQVFAPDVIQPLFDLADPNNPIHKELGTPIQSNGINTNTVIIKDSPALQRTPSKVSQQESSHVGNNNLSLSDPNVIVQLQHLQRLLNRGENSSKPEVPVHFDRKLLEFDYGDDEDDANSSPKAPPNDSISNILTNPEVLRQLQTLQQSMTTGYTGELDIDKLRKLQEMKQQEDEFDKHLAQTVPNLPFASECEFKPGGNSSLTSSYYLPATDLSQPPPGYKLQQYDLSQPENIDNDVQFVGGENDNGADIEVINLDHSDSRSPTPHEDRYNRRRKSRSRDRSKDRRDRDRRSRRSRSRSRTRRHRSRSRDRSRVKERETEKDKERKKRGLPVIKRENLSVCSTTLWVGHLSKLVHQEDLSNTFGEFGDIVSIDLIPPRGCAFIVMHRRQDAARCLTKLKNHILHGKAITLAWAPGKGVKGKDLKDYWEGDLGVSYIPWTKLKPDIDIEMLEDGGMIDEDTMPVWLKTKIASMTSTKSLVDVVHQTNFTMQQLTGVDNSTNKNQTIDTSQPPPIPNTNLLQPPPMALPLVTPFQFNNRLIGPVGMNLPPGILPNVPIGVPPPNLPPGTMMQNQLLSFQGPPNLMQQLSQVQNNNNNSSGGGGGDKNQTNDNLMNITNPFGIISQPPINLSSSSTITQHDDNMDIEMEDAEKIDNNRPLSLSEQLEASMAQFNRNGHRGNNSNDLPPELDAIREKLDDRNERNNRNSRSLERDRDRNNRDRGHYNNNNSGRDRDFNNRKDDRNNRNKDERRERNNRWDDPNDNNDNNNDRRDREKILNDRLQQMANESNYSKHERRERSAGSGDDQQIESNLPALLDRPMYPPNKSGGGGGGVGGVPFPPNPDMDDLYIRRNDEFDQRASLIDDYQSSMDYGPDWQSPHSRMRGGDFEQGRFMRPGPGGRRDFRDDFDPRMRFPPRGGSGGGGPDFFSPRDGFGGQRPPPNMRGGPDFPLPRPPPPGMRPPGPHKFYPRGPPMRGPRPGMMWKDRPNFGPRMEHGDFYRRPPGPPGMYDDYPHSRHRDGSRGGSGGKYDDRRRSRSDFNYENGSENEQNNNNNNNERRSNSRWADSSNRSVDENDVSNEMKEENLNNDDSGNSTRENKGAGTPLHDEPFNSREMKEENLQENQVETISLIDDNVPLETDKETNNENTNKIDTTVNEHNNQIVIDE